MSKNLLDDKSGYIKYALMNCNPDSSSKQANYAYKKLTNYYKAFEKNLPSAETFLKSLIEQPDENFSVLQWACAHALGLGVLTDEAVSSLSKIIEEGKNDNLKTLESRWNSIAAEQLLKKHNDGEKIFFYHN